MTDNQLFFSSNEMIHSVGLNYLQERALWDDPELLSWDAYPYTFLVYGQDVFFINMDSLELCRFSANLNGPLSYSGETASATVLVEESVITFTISEDVIYYTTTTFDDMPTKLYKMSLDGGGKTFLVEGKSPIVLGNYLFYFDNDNKMVFMPK